MGRSVFEDEFTTVDLVASELASVECFLESLLVSDGLE